MSVGRARLRAVSPRRASSLSKSRFCHGLQCLKQLWWRAHERQAPELVPPPALQVVFDRGSLVGERARAEFPGGTLVEGEPWAVAAKVAATRAALAADAPAIYEASFEADGVFAAVDVLERRPDGHAIVEVKSTLEVKDQFIPDVAIQLHVARRSGLAVARAEVMHLDRACRFPDLSNLFAREDVTARAEAFLPEIPAHLERMRAALAGPLPVVATGPHCSDPYDCPFLARCWPPLPPHHVSTLFRGGRQVEALLAAGVTRLEDVPAGTPLGAAAARQVRAIQAGRVVVEGDLAGALAALAPPVAYLDFETVAPAIPAWPGCGPYQAVPVQMSCHVATADGALVHHAHLAAASAGPDGPDDPRPALAAAVVSACAGAATVVAYNASFERRCLEQLAERVPALQAPLLDVAGKLVDLLPIVRDHVYHPDFGGSFSMKAVAPALVPGLGYAGLEIGEGGAASSALEGLLLGGGDEPDAAVRAELRRQLLAYCEQDTLAMVKVVEALRTLAGRWPGRRRR